MSSLPQRPTESFIRRNPHLYQGVPIADQRGWDALKQIAAGKRIRQDSKPLMNKLEQEWFDILKASHWMSDLRAQAKRYKLGNGIWFKPDATGKDTRDGRETAYEVKGPHAFRGGFENLKVAAATWTDVTWILVWKAGGEWQQQRVLP